MPNFRGKNVVVLFNAVNISGDGRSVSYTEKSDVLDDSKYGQDARTKQGGLLDGSGSFDGMDKTGDWSAAWEAMQPGDSATMQIRPEGTGAGLREVSFTALISERGVEYPYDQLATVKMSFEISGDVGESTQGS